ncbi:unnamed protein product, partial [Discosporangium mesarthrocarpum]
RNGRKGSRSSSRVHTTVFDLWLYIQMQYCTHNNLQHFLEEGQERRGKGSKARGVDMPHILHVFLQVSRGLGYVHGRGLIHRDLKPANCFLLGDGTVKIGDFGLSRHILSNDGLGMSSASAGTSASPASPPAPSMDPSITGGVGTYLYASPEQMSGQGYDAKTDIYSLGMLLFEMCHVPFTTRMERTLVLSEAHKLVFPPPTQWGPVKGQEFARNLCRSMLQTQPEDRPSAMEVVHQVELMQGKHFLLQMDDKQPQWSSRYGQEAHRGLVAVVLRVETVEREGLLHQLVDRIKAMCGGFVRQAKDP